MKFRLCILIGLITAYLPCSGQGYFKLLGDSTASNYLLGGFKLQQGGSVLHGRLHVSGFPGPGVAAFSRADALGNPVWQKYVSFNGLFNMVQTGIELPSGELMFFNSYDSAPSNDGFLIFKTDSSGNVLWTKTYSTSSLNTRTVHDVIISHDNNILLGATIGSVSALNAEQTVFKIDTAGNILWNNGFRMQNGGDDYIHALQEGPDHCIYIIGERTLTVGGGTHSTFSKMDSLGNVLWSKRYDFSSPPSPDASFRALRVLPSGNLLICGSTAPTTSVSPFTFLFETDTSGTILWQQNFTNNNGSLVAYSLATDTMQRIHLKGTVSNPNNLFNLVTDSSGTVYSSWKLDGDYITNVPVFSTSTHPPGFFAVNRVATGYSAWALIEVDSMPQLCSVQPLNISLLPQFSFTTNNTSLVTHVNNLTMANFSLNQGILFNITDGCMVTGVSEHNTEKSLTVLPNPAIEHTRFELPENVRSLMIVDAYGKIIHQDHPISGNTYEFDCSLLPTGIYFLVCGEGNNSLHKTRFMVCR